MVKDFCGFGPEGANLILGFKAEDARLEAERLLEEAGMARSAINRLKNHGGWSYIPRGEAQEKAAVLLRWALEGVCPVGVDRAASALSLLEGTLIPTVPGRHGNTNARETWQLWEVHALALTPEQMYEEAVALRRHPTPEEEAEASAGELASALFETDGHEGRAALLWSKLGQGSYPDKKTWARAWEIYNGENCF